MLKSVDGVIDATKGKKEKKPTKAKIPVRSASTNPQHCFVL